MLDMILEKGRQCHITKQLVNSFSVIIRISERPPRLCLGGHHFLGLTKPDVNLKRMHQLYNVLFGFRAIINSYMKSILMEVKRADKKTILTCYLSLRIINARQNELVTCSFRVTEENLVFETVQSGPYSSFVCFLCS